MPVRRRSTPVSINASTAAFTFSTPASANTTGVVVEPMCPTGVQQHGHAVHRCERLGHTPGKDPSREVVDHRMEIGACPIEQANDGRVNVPHLVWAGRAQSHLRLSGMPRNRGRRQPYWRTGGTTSTATRTPCRAAARGPPRCRSGRGGSRLTSPCPRSLDLDARQSMR